MVSARVISDISKFDTYCTRTETLSEWITTVRYKKGVIRRQRKTRDLRVAAVLTTAIMRAEMELRRKQNERAQRWAEVRAQYGGGMGESCSDQSSSSTSMTSLTTTTTQSPWNDRENNNMFQCSESSSNSSDLERDEEIAKLWTSELVGLDNMFHDLNQIKTVVAR